MAAFKDFREIVAWQLAYEIRVRVDEFLSRPDFKRQYKFCDQLSDAARSGPRNIAEGHVRFKHKEFAQFLRVAKGSEGEVLNHLIDARDQRLITYEELIAMERLIKRAMKAAIRLIQYLESTPDPPPPGHKRPKEPGKRQ